MKRNRVVCLRAEASRSSEREGFAQADATVGKYGKAIRLLYPAEEDSP